MNRRTTLIAPMVALGSLALPAIMRGGDAFAAGGETSDSQIDAETPGATLTVPQFKHHVLQYGTLSLLTSQIAKGRTTNGYVADFAVHEALEQISVAQSLLRTGSPPLAKLTPKQQASLDMVANASGSGFDPVYLAVQLDGHKHLFYLLNTFLTATPDYKADLVHIALIGRAFVKHHTHILEELIAAGA